jgi:hypothetical protein
LRKKSGNSFTNWKLKSNLSKEDFEGSKFNFFDKKIVQIVFKNSPRCIIKYFPKIVGIFPLKKATWL